MTDQKKVYNGNQWEKLRIYISLSISAPILHHNWNRTCCFSVCINFGLAIYLLKNLAILFPNRSRSRCLTLILLLKRALKCAFFLSFLPTRRNWYNWREIRYDASKESIIERAVGFYNGKTRLELQIESVVSRLPRDRERERGRERERERERDMYNDSDTSRRVRDYCRFSRLQYVSANKSSGAECKVGRWEEGRSIARPGRNGEGRRRRGWCVPEIDMAGVTVSGDKPWQRIRSFNVGIAPRERFLREEKRRK
jgi:hypothetical protein